MMNKKMKILETIHNLQCEMISYRNAKMFGKVAEIRLEITRLQSLLSETY